MLVGFKVKVYTDGSYLKQTPNKSYGAAVIMNEDESDILACQRCEILDRDIVTSRNVGGELIGAMVGYVNACAIIDGMCKAAGKETEGVVEIHHDYTGVRQFVQGPKQWKNVTKYGPLLYVSMVNKMKRDYPKIQLTFVKEKAHSGIYGNELADSIAGGHIPAECVSKMKDTVVIKPRGV